ncbi:16S rRNA (cytosine(1402)-N(4))-methyltransferase RsmH [Helicobacter trogontum]|uniref:Multifunctional fusion protein n=1 Tax=Helicobacter trogontum TaxID=50960 RepID=A0A4U8TE00_9HELI|nr:16S rRNA (cytosine(1402)-N(4))-methyltransferase RsmH [Helicobacter trogontum]TLD98256.1 16S rRNA (cytosine(1402)-N(4))-methyltransferase RsmH [Helicobacter trogontum]
MIFGIDFGLKRLGMAKVVQNIIVPLAPIMRKNRNQASKELRRVLIEHESDMSKITLVVGMPLSDLDMEEDGAGRHETMQKRISHFLNLIDFCGQIVYIDESYSSKEASERLFDRGYNTRKKARKNGMLDSISACVILERYLEKQENISHINKLDCSSFDGKKQNGVGCITQTDRIETHIIEPQDKISHIQTKPINKTDRQECILVYAGSKDLGQGKTDLQTTRDARKDLQQQVICDRGVAQIDKTPHIPVLLEHVLDTFDRVFIPTHTHYIAKKSPIKNKEVLIDCTLGFGGMSKALLERYPDLYIIGIDRDSYALEYNQKPMAMFGDRFQTRHGDFGTLLPYIINEIQQSGNRLCGVLADIGVSSYQLDTIERGFSFHANTLDMRMDRTQTLNADMIVNTYSKYELEEIFKNYGEIREYKKLVNLIIQERTQRKITADKLQNIALKLHTKSKIHPATLIYQALRIAVNDELEQLQKLLASCVDLHEVLLCIISFHSLEDRIIKDAFKQFAKKCICDATSFKCTCGNNHAKGFSLYKKPLVADNKEILYNKRSRSAKLRAFYFM